MIAATRLALGDIEAMLLPAQGMLCASLTHRGVEVLRHIDDLDAAAATGGTAGIPLLHPWANRLPGMRYRAAGRDVVLDPSSPLLHLDANGLSMHGVPWSRLSWDVVDARADRLVAVLDWKNADLLKVFPFPHRLEMTAALLPDGIHIATALVAGDEGPVPASFGFHPYVGLPDSPRAQWRLRLPAMRQLALDERGIPTGADQPFAALDAPLGRRAFDHGFALLDAQATLLISAGGRTIAIELLEGYTHAQVFAPIDKDLIALEPMTAPTAALASGRGLRLVAPGSRLSTAFSIRVAGY